MVLELYSPVVGDLLDITRMIFDGFSESPVAPLMYPVPVPEEQILRTAEDMKEDYNTDPDYTLLAIKDTDTDKVISCCEWEVVPEKKNDDWQIYKQPPCPPGWFEDYWKYSAKLSWQSKLDAIGRQPYIYLQSLVTPAEHRRRGAASILIKALLEFQQKVNLPIYLIASPDGARLYPKFGFKEVSRYELDMSALGTSEKRIQVGMLRAAPSPDKLAVITDTPQSPLPAPSAAVAAAAILG